MSRLLERLEIKPDDCETRLRATFATDDLGQAVRDLVELGMEVIDLVEAHLPEVNETSLFEGHPWVNTTWARKRWVAYPALHADRQYGSRRWGARARLTVFRATALRQAFKGISISWLCW